MSCDLQFGLKANSSTNICSMVLEEAMAYHVQHQSLCSVPFWTPRRPSTYCNTLNYSSHLRGASYPRTLLGCLSIFTHIILFLVRGNVWLYWRVTASSRALCSSVLSASLSYRRSTSVAFDSWSQLLNWFPLADDIVFVADNYLQGLSISNI